MAVPAPVRYKDTFAEKWVRLLSPAAWRDCVAMEFREVPLSALEHAGCPTDPDVVAGWLETMSAERPVPPPVATMTERGTFYLHDGNHRLEAMRQYYGDDTARVRVAVVRPLGGFAFERRKMDGYETYVLAPVPSLVSRFALFGIALFASLLATLVTSHVPGRDESPFFVLYVAAVLVCARWGGWAMGVVAAVVNAAAAAYILLPPTRSFWIEDRAHLVQFTVTALVMVLVSFLFGRRQQLSLRLRSRDGDF